MNYEKGEWDVCFTYIDKMGMCENDVIKAYKEAVVWADDIVIGA